MAASPQDEGGEEPGLEGFEADGDDEVGSSAVTDHRGGEGQEEGELPERGPPSARKGRDGRSPRRTDPTQNMAKLRKTTGVLGPIFDEGAGPR
jgi:hypothetical protein